MSSGEKQRLVRARAVMRPLVNIRQSSHGAASGRGDRLILSLNPQLHIWYAVFTLTLTLKLW